jgi:hypothetical protein
MAPLTIKELLVQVERSGRRLEGLLRALEFALQEAEQRGETAVSRDPVLGPELPNGEGIGGEISAGIRGLADPAPGDIADYLADLEERKKNVHHG